MRLRSWPPRRRELIGRPRHPHAGAHKHARSRLHLDAAPPRRRGPGQGPDGRHRPHDAGANAALRSIVRRDTGESYQDFLTKLAHASGIKTPTRADLARIDRVAQGACHESWAAPAAGLIAQASLDRQIRLRPHRRGRTGFHHRAASPRMFVNYGTGEGNKCIGLIC